MTQRLPEGTPPRARKTFSVQISGEEYNPIMLCLGAIGGRAFGASPARDGIDVLQIATDCAVDALERLGGDGVGQLVKRMGDACEAAYGAAAMTTNARESASAAKIPFPKSKIQ